MKSFLSLFLIIGDLIDFLFPFEIEALLQLISRLLFNASKCVLLDLDFTSTRQVKFILFFNSICFGWLTVNDCWNYRDILIFIDFPHRFLPLNIKFYSEYFLSFVKVKNSYLPATKSFTFVFWPIPENIFPFYVIFVFDSS